MDAITRVFLITKKSTMTKQKHFACVFWKIKPMALALLGAFNLQNMQSF